MIYLQLFLSFFKIGLFGFGGGLAILSLIEMEVETNGWMTQKEFVDIVAVSQVTPGPIGINCAPMSVIRQPVSGAACWRPPRSCCRA